MIKSKNFKKNNKFYHLNFEYLATGLFKDLDWEFVLFQVGTYSMRYQIQIHALVMMDTHIHLLFLSTESTENFFADHLIQKISPQGNGPSLLEPINHLSQYFNTYKYIYRNPVEAGLCQKVEDYPYSSLQMLLGLKNSHVLFHDSLNLIVDAPMKLKWLNTKNTNYKPVTFKSVFQDSSLAI